jgi:glycosyltransferase involved in cell wall biosynthesis
MPIRVLQVLSQDLVGGTELLVELVAPRLAAAGMDSQVATLDEPGPVARRLAEGGLPVYTLGRGRVVGGVRLGRLVRGGGFDVVEAYGFKASVIARVFWPRRARSRLVHGVMGAHLTEVLDFDEAKGRFALAVERLLSGRVDAYDVISRDAIDLLADHGIERARMHYIPNGVDLSRWPPRGEAPREEPPVVLCSARFVNRKRQEDLIRAAALLAERSVPCRFVLFGEGPNLERDRRLAAELGVAGMVDLPGAVPGEAVRLEMERATLFCLPSLWEGQAGALIEAMATGVPVVTTDTPGNRELVDHGQNGLLVPPRDPAALADAIERIVSHPDDGRAMAAESRRRVEQTYNLDAMVERKRALYEALVAGAAGA